MPWARPGAPDAMSVQRLIKGALLFRKGVIVTNVPYHLAQ